MWWKFRASLIKIQKNMTFWMGNFCFYFYFVVSPWVGKGNVIKWWYIKFKEASWIVVREYCIVKDKPLSVQTAVSYFFFQQLVGDEQRKGAACCSSEPRTRASCLVREHLIHKANPLVSVSCHIDNTEICRQRCCIEDI